MIQNTKHEHMIDSAQNAVSKYADVVSKHADVVSKHAKCAVTQAISKSAMSIA